VALPVTVGADPAAGVEFYKAAEKGDTMCSTAGQAVTLHDGATGTTRDQRETRRPEWTA
jgi:hypothetical protein